MVPKWRCWKLGKIRKPFGVQMCPQGSNWLLFGGASVGGRVRVWSCCYCFFTFLFGFVLLHWYGTVPAVPSKGRKTALEELGKGSVALSL